MAILVYSVSQLENAAINWHPNGRPPVVMTWVQITGIEKQEAQLMLTNPPNAF